MSDRHPRALQRSFADVLGSFAALGEVFVMTRNDSCVLSTVASPLYYRSVGYRSLAWSEELTLRLSTRKSPEVVAFYEDGGEAEFFDDRNRGFLKVFPSEGVPAAEWNDTVARMATGFYPLEALPFLRKTNHLSGPDTSFIGAELAVLPPVDLRQIINAFFAQATGQNHALTVSVPCGMLRAELAFAPTEFAWKGPWLFATSPVSGCHLRVGRGYSARTSGRAGGLQLLDIFDGDGGFVARLTSRPKTSLKS